MTFQPRNKRVFRPSMSESVISMTSSEMAGQRYGVSQDLTTALPNVASKVRKNVTEGYKQSNTFATPQHALHPQTQSATQLPQPNQTFIEPPISSSMPAPPTFLSNSDAVRQAAISVEEQRMSDAVRSFKPQGPLRPYFDQHAEDQQLEEERRQRRRSGGDADMEVMNGWPGMDGLRPAQVVRGTKRTNPRDEDEGSLSEGEDTDVDEDVVNKDLPSRPPFGVHASFSSSSSSLLHPLAGSNATAWPDHNSPIPINANKSRYGVPNSQLFGEARRAPLRPTKSLPARVFGGGDMMDGVEESTGMQDGFDVSEWANRTDF